MLTVDSCCDHMFVALVVKSFYCHFYIHTHTEHLWFVQVRHKMTKKVYAMKTLSKFEMVMLYVRLFYYMTCKSVSVAELQCSFCAVFVVHSQISVGVKDII